MTSPLRPRALAAFRGRRPALAALALAAALSACDAGKDPDGPCGGTACPEPPRLEVASVQEVGFIGKPAKVAGRDGAQSAAMNGKLLWLFGDTFFATKSVDGYNYRTNTGTIADLATPTATSEPLDANGIPYAAIPWTADELVYNANSGSGTDRVALWNAGLVPDAPRGTLLAFFEKLYTKPEPQGWTAAGIGTARFAPGQTKGTRAPGLLFDVAKGEPLFKHALLHDGTVYLYGRMSTGGGLARAPLARAEERAAYTFWDGRGWSADVTKAAPLANGAPGEMSVAWNAHLGRFVGVYSALFGTRVLARTAPRPEGPWSDAVPLFDTRKGPSGNESTYVGSQHPALEKDGGKTIAVTYSLPTDCFLCGEVVLVNVTLR